MWSISEMKERGKAFKGNYWVCVLVGIIMSIFVVEYGTSSAAKSGENDINLTDLFHGLTSGEKAAVIAAIFTALGVVTIVSLLLKIFFINPLTVGCHAFYRDNIKNTPAAFGVLKVGFANYGKTFITLFLRDLFLFFWFLLLFIPGIIKVYSYRMVPYILSDNPDISPMDAIRRSKEMMQGHKWRTFVLDLSFIGWFILSALTCGILFIFWTGPYIYSTDAALYLKLKDN